MRKVLLVIDMQNDFIDGTLGTKEAHFMLPKAVERVSKAKEEGWAVIFTKDTHGANYLQTEEGKKLPVEHCRKGTNGWEIQEQLRPYVEEVIEKNTFGSIALPERVASYEEIELIGVCTDICVISNALLLKAHYPEKKISVNASCCAGVTPETHNNALEAMKMCQIEIQ